MLLGVEGDFQCALASDSETQNVLALLKYNCLWFKTLLKVLCE